MRIELTLTDAEADALITVLTESRDEYSNAIEEFLDDEENDWSVEIEDCNCRRDALNKLLTGLKNAVC